MGRSTRFTSPSPWGPTTIPATISSTTAGTRMRGKTPTISGAATAMADTTTRLANDTLGMSALSQWRPQALRQPGRVHDEVARLQQQARVLERATRIELAFSAWEAGRSCA